MSRNFTLMAPVVSVALAVAMLAGCGASPMHTLSAAAITSSSAAVKSEAESRKLTRVQAEARAKTLIAAFDTHNWQSINARTNAVQKIAATGSNTAYDFLLDEGSNVQDLRDSMTSISEDDADQYETTVAGYLDQMTPDQTVVKARVAKAEALGMDLDELTIQEEQQAESTNANTATPAQVAAADGTQPLEAMWGGQATVGSSNRLLSAIENSKVYKFCKRAVRNTSKWIKTSLHSICVKIHFCS